VTDARHLQDRETAGMEGLAGPQPAGGVAAAAARPAAARQLASPPPRWLAAAAMRLRRIFRAAADAVVPPPVAVFEQIAAYMQTHLLRAAARLRIADLLAAGPLSAEELAPRAGVQAAGLHRLMRGLVTLGVFAQGRDGRFANNRASATLRADAPISLRDAALYFGSAAQLRAWDGLEETLATGADAFALAHGMGTWEWFDRHDAERDAFAGTMVAMTRLFAPGVATAYPFAAVRRLCDVGGSQGDLLAEVLRRHPRLTAVLLDSPAVLASALPLLAARGVAERVQLLPGSFFDAVPPGCDAYLLKNILHDWDDPRAARILDNCRRAMQPGHRLLVVETVVEESTTREIGPLSDLQMMVVCGGGRERSRAGYARLFAAAGFRLARVVPTAGPMSVIEGLAL
jgi:C-methyltransferase